LGARKSTDDFIEAAREVHGYRYSYENCSYVNNKTDVLITCFVHGDFPQKPSNHLNGKGCPRCSKSGLRSVDYAGYRYGKLTVVRRALTPEGHKSKNNYWYVQCACGRDPYVVATTAFKAKTRHDASCGHCSSLKRAETRRRMMNPNIVGSRFGRLEVLREWGRDRTAQVRVLCQCDCGDQTICYRSNVIKGDTTSCGCYWEEVFGADSLKKMKQDPEWASVATFLYLASVNDEFLKIGIARNLAVRKRASQGFYREYLYSAQMKRCEAWAIEQILLYETKEKAPGHLSSRYANWAGRTELRDDMARVAWYEGRILMLIHRIKFDGWLAVLQSSVPRAAMRQS